MDRLVLVQMAVGFGDPQRRRDLGSGHCLLPMGAGGFRSVMGGGGGT